TGYRHRTRAGRWSGNIRMPCGQTSVHEWQRRGRQCGDRFTGRELDRFEKLHKIGFLPGHELTIAGHFEKPRHSITTLDHRQNAGWLASRVLAVLFVEVSRLASQLHGLRELLQFILGHRLLADLAAPTVDVAKVATSLAR